MFTQEQKTRKLEQAQTAVDDATHRVEVHQGRLDQAKKDLDTAKATQEWLKSMPVNGSAPEPEPAPAV